MTTRVLPVLGLNINVRVPETADEYNSLAPKRANAVVEDAVASTCYRSVSPVLRSALCDILEKRGVARINHGTEDEPNLEKEGVFVKRAKAQLVAGGISESQLDSELTSALQSVADTDKDAQFDPSLREGSGDGPAIGKRDLKMAQQVIADGKADAIAGKLAVILGREVPTDEKSLARAIADNRRNLAAQAEAQQRAALGM